MNPTTIFGAALAAGLAAVLATAPAYGQETIRISTPSQEITAFCMGIRIARHANFPGPSRKYRLAFQDIAMLIPQVPVNVSNNEIDIGECSGISTVLNAWQKGAKNLVVFAFGSELPVYQLVGSKDIKRLSDLKGKNIGIPGIQSAGAEAVEMILKRGSNLLPQRDYNFVQVGAGPATMAALVAGKIDAIPYFPPFTYELEKLGYPVLADEVTYVPRYVTGTHVASRSWVEKNREQFVRVLKAIVETGDWLKDPANEKQVVEWFAQNVSSGGKEKLEPRFAQRMYDFYIKEKRLSFNGYAPEEAVRANIEILRERGHLKDSLPPLGQIFDFSYLNQALRELGRPTVQEYAGR